jgi:hypothetical protein
MSSSFVVADTGVGSTTIMDMVPLNDTIVRLVGFYRGTPVFGGVSDLPEANQDESFFLNMLILTQSDIPKFNSISVYPNPVRSDLTITSLEVILESVVYDTQGREQARFQGQKKIPTHNLVPGYYLLNVKLINGKIETIPFIKL